MVYQYKLQNKTKLKLEQSDQGFKMSNKVPTAKPMRLYNRPMEKSTISTRKVIIWNSGVHYVDASVWTYGRKITCNVFIILTHFPDGNMA